MNITPRLSEDAAANFILAKAMGSKRGYDPMPPDQHQWQRSEGEPPLYRLWSWMCAHTIAFGKRSPFAVDAHGRPRGLSHAAKDLGMDKGQVSRTWKEGEERGLWHRQGRQLYLNGDVSTHDIFKARQSKKVDGTVNLSRNEILKIKHLPKSEQEAFYALWEPAQEFRRDLAAAAIAQAREACDVMDDSILRRVGIERKRSGKKDRPPLAVPQMLFEFVQSTPALVTVQVTPVDGTAGEETGENLAARPVHIRNSEKPSEKPSPPPAFVPALNAGGSVGQPSEQPDRPADPIPFPTDLKPQDALLESIDRMLTDTAADLQMGERPGHALCLQVADGLKGAPLENLHELMLARRKRQKILDMGLGICREFAHEVGRAFVREAAARKRAADEKAARDAHELEQIQLTAKQTLEDPRAGPDEKEWAREILGINSKKTGGGA